MREIGVRSVVLTQWQICEIKNFPESHMVAENYANFRHMVYDLPIHNIYVLRVFWQRTLMPGYSRCAWRGVFA